MNSLDLFIQNYFYLNHTPKVSQFMHLVSELFDPTLSVILLISFSALLIYLSRNLNTAILFLGALTSGWVVVYLLKHFFDVSRPLNGVVATVGQSFPSGHTTIATIFFVMIIYIFRHQFRGLWSVFFNIFCIVCIVLVGFSRIYLGAHWVSDVFGGLILGLAISYVSIKIFKKFTL